MTKKIPTPFKLGLALALGLSAISLIGACLNTSPETNLAMAFAKPSFSHWLGCDAYGIDIGKRILEGAWQSLRIASLVTITTMALGLLIGTLAGLSRTWLDVFLSRVIDCFLAFPGLLLAILLAAIMPHSEGSILFALIATGWTARARFCRALVQTLKSQPHIEAAKATGASKLRVLTQHIWPLLLGQLLIQAALSMGHTIIAEASLSFLGLGGGINNASWGKLIAEGRDYLVEAPHLTFFPGIVFILSVISFNLIAEGLRMRLDPKQAVGLY